MSQHQNTEICPVCSAEMFVLFSNHIVDTVSGQCKKCGFQYDTKFDMDGEIEEIDKNLDFEKNIKQFEEDFRLLDEHEKNAYRKHVEFCKKGFFK